MGFTSHNNLSEVGVPGCGQETTLLAVYLEPYVPALRADAEYES